MKIHSPTLDSIIVVEEYAKKYSTECGKYQLWRKLPKRMMYQTFQVILKYLQESGKLFIDGDKKIVWTHNPQLVKRILAERKSF